MKYEPTQHLHPHKLPHIKLEELIEESFLLDDHGNAILGDRAKTPKYTTDPAKIS